MSFYNTISHRGTKMTRARKKAENQDTLVLRTVESLIKRGYAEQMTARRIWWAYTRLYGPVQLTSIRRSINTLIKLGSLSHVKLGPKKYKKIEDHCPIEIFKTSERQVIRV